MELAASFARETNEVTAQHAAVLQVGALQMIEALLEYGDDSLKRMFQVNPLNYIRMLEAMPRQAQAAIYCDRQRAQTATHSALKAEK